MSNSTNSTINYTQLQTTLAPLVTAIAGFMAGKGYFGWDAQTWITVLGSVGTVAGIVWGSVAARKSALISTTASMPEVKEVTLDKTVAGTAALNAATPDNVVSK